MTDLTSTAEILLQEAKYRTWPTSVERMPLVCFEDETVFGFVRVFGSASELLAQWQRTENSFLRSHSLSLSRAGEKAWNVYSIFVTGDEPNETLAREVRQIEENLDRTRKIAASGIAGGEDLLTALLPVLPLQYQPSIESINFAGRLRERLSTIAPRVADAVFDETIPATEVARLLGAPS